MKECNKVFFGEKGLTQTSANHLANIAKEMVESNKQVLDSVGFITVTASLLSGGNVATVKTGKPDGFLTNVPVLLSEIGDMNAFCAWMREAIKARENELADIERLDIEDYCKQVNKEFPIRPDRDDLWTEEDALAQMNVAERMEYYKLEAEAAAIGKYIHPRQSYAIAREELMKRVANPTSLTGEGVNTIVYRYAPSANSDLVEQTFFDLQNKHRSLSARLNKIKFNIKAAVDSHNSAVNAKFSEALTSYRNQIDVLHSELTVYKDEQRKALLKLKIVIPKELAAIYQVIDKVANPKEDK